MTAPYRGVWANLSRQEQIVLAADRTVDIHPPSPHVMRRLQDRGLIGHNWCLTELGAAVLFARHQETQ